MFTVAGNILKVVMVYLDFIQNLIKLILRENIDKLAVQDVKDLILLQRSSQDRGNMRGVQRRGKQAKSPEMTQR